MVSRGDAGEPEVFPMHSRMFPKECEAGTCAESERKKEVERRSEILVYGVGE